MPLSPGSITSFSFTWGGKTRTYWIYIPNPQPTEKMGVMVALHAGTQDAMGFRTMAKLDAASNARGIAVVYPEGIGRSWNAGGCCGTAVTQNIDDLGFVTEILARLPGQGNFDMTRVWAMGFSNGAMLAHLLASKRSEHFAAIGACSGGLLQRTVTPTYKIPILHCHGLEDTHVPYMGGIGPDALDHFNHPSIPNVVIPYWDTANGANASAVVLPKSGYTIETHTGVAPVVLYKLTTLGHVYVTGTPIDETATILDFVRLYRRQGQMADVASVKVLWARRIKLNSTQTGAIEVAVRIRNTGTVEWASSARSVRGHVKLKDGTFFRDVSVSGAIIDVDVPQGAEIDRVIQFRSAGFTAGLNMVDLFHNETLVIVDVVQETVGWIGSPAASFYVSEATGLVEDLRLAADRLGLRVAPAFTTAVPTSGSPAGVFDHTVDSSGAHYYLGFTAFATGGARRITAYVTKAGESEQPYGSYLIPADTTLPVDLRNLRVGPGGRFRMVAEVNASGGFVDMHLDYLRLPWED